MQIDILLTLQTLGILFLSVMSPGPDFMIVLRNALTYGRKAGFFSALGIATGCLISFTVLVSGLKFLLAYPSIKILLSVVCGIYLIYMGFKSIRNKSGHKHINYEHKKRSSLIIYFRNGLVTNLFNPKLYTLSGAILTYTESQHPSIATNVSIVIGQGMLSLIWFACIGYIFSYSKIQDAFFRRERTINLLLGAVFIIIGLRVIFAN